MKAYVLTAAGPAFAERDAPEPGPGDVLIRVRACGLNRIDLAMARGHRHGGAGGDGAVLGVEWAGQVRAVGERVERFVPGDRVMGSGAGAFAEYAVADAGRVLPIPESMSYEQAAASPVALLTMHDAVVTQGRLAPGQSLLVHGASSGVGLMALLIGRALRAGLVAGSSRDPTRRKRLRDFGAQLVVDPEDPSWVDTVLEATGGRGVDVFIDQVSGSTIRNGMLATRIGGRIVNVGRLGGATGDFDFDLHALRRLHYVGVTFRTRSRAEVAEIARGVASDLLPALAEGGLRLPIDSVFAFDEVASALEHMRADQHFGKIVLRL